MSLKAMLWALYEAPVLGVSDGSRLVLQALADHADTAGRNAWPHASSLAVDLGVSVRTIRRRLEELETAGLIMRGDQEVVSHLRAGYRPVVWDLPMHLGRGDASAPLKPFEARAENVSTWPVSDEENSAGRIDPDTITSETDSDGCGKAGVTGASPLGDMSVPEVTAVAGRGDSPGTSEVTPGDTQNRPRTKTLEPSVVRTSATTERARDEVAVEAHDSAPPPVLVTELVADGRRLLAARGIDSPSAIPPPVCTPEETVTRTPPPAAREQFDRIRAARASRRGWAPLVAKRDAADAGSTCDCA